MTHAPNDQPEVSLSSRQTARRPLIRAIAGASALGAFGLPSLAGAAGASISDVTIEFKKCRAVLVSNASSVGTIRVYYADREGARKAVYGIDPMGNIKPQGPPQEEEPLVVDYNADEDRTQIQLREPKGSLVCVVAEADGARISSVNPSDGCVPTGFNTVPTAAFTAETDDTPATTGAITVDVGEQVTFTSTASDPDDPERLHYEWDLGSGNFDTTSPTTTATYTESGDVDVRHRITDDFGESETAMMTLTVEASGPSIPSQQVGKLIPDDETAHDHFGRSVSLDGDTALVGAPEYVDNKDNDPGYADGSAYVFVRSGSTWTQQAKLVPDDAAPEDRFGVAVSLDGDTALVGAYTDNDDDTGYRNTGSAYVFVRSGNTWTQQAKLTPSDPQFTDDYFGFAVSLSGDTALIGMFLDDDTGYADGSVYVFVRSGDTWTQQAKLFDGNGNIGGDNFGITVSLDGDTAVVGAVADDHNGFDSGVAYVFVRSGTTWTQQAELVPDDGYSLDHFGRSVSVSGDTVIVGARLDDDNGTDSGSAYVFTRSGTAWSQQAKLLAGDGAADDRFGFATSLDGDIALIGAHSDDDTGTNSGSAYVFVRSGTTWTQQAKFTSSDGATYAHFGIDVSIDDGTALVGAYSHDADDGTHLASGSAYVFE